MAFERPRDGVNAIDSAIENLVLTLKRYGRLAEASECEAKLLVSQLRRERLRSQTAMARTRALVAEMELHVVQRHLNAMKNQSQSDERSASNHQRLTLPVNHKQNKASERKSSKTDSNRSSLHKIDKKSLSIAKPTCKNCLKLQTTKQRTTEGPKRANESEPQIPSDANKNATTNNAVPEVSKRFKEADAIDVIPPSKDKAEVERSNNAVIPETNNEDPKIPPTATSPIAKKIFGIAHYIVGQHENMANSGKESRRILQEVAKRTSRPKANSKNKANQAKKAANSSLSINSQKDKAVVPNKLATEVKARGADKERTVKETLSLRISLPLTSKLNSKVEKARKSLFGVTKQHCSDKDDKKLSKATPTVSSSKKEKEKQISHQKMTESPHHSKVAPAEEIEVIVHADKDMRKRGKENVKPQSLPIRVCLSQLTKNIADFQNKKDARKSVEVENKKEQRENENAAKPSVRVCLPLTESNLANFNRNNVFTQSQRTAQEGTTQVADNNIKQTQSLKISVPLNNCLSYTEAECERNKPNQEFLEIQTGRRVAWKSINWDAWEAQKKKEEYTRPDVDEKQRPNYTFVKRGPMRKVSWEEFMRRLSLNEGTNALSQSPSAKKTCVKPTINTENAENLPATTTTDVRTNEDLEIPSTKSAESKERTMETAREVTNSEVDQDATNAIFNQIMVKKEMNASNADDSRSISSNDTALLCTRCECLHESKECPKMKYFKFLGIDNLKTEI